VGGPISIVKFHDSIRTSEEATDAAAGRAVGEHAPSGAGITSVAPATSHGSRLSIVTPDPCAAAECRLGGQTLRAECRQLEREEWDAVLAGFQDGSLFQTWAYGAGRWGRRNLSHLILKDGQTVVGAAQIILAKLPGLRVGLAYVKWGPMWHVRGRAPNPQVFRALLRSLRRTYARDRGLLIRVTPWEFEGTAFRSIPDEEGFQRKPLATQRTAVLDLTCSLDELRFSLSRHWRSNLKRAERSGLEVSEGDAEDLLDEFAELYHQMRIRKASEWIPPIHYLPQVQRALSPSMKAQISICRHQGRPIAGLVVSALGERSFAWLAATGEAGQDLRGSYLLQWRAIQRLKSLGVRTYDLGGINEITHPGTTQFKLGLCGKRGRTPTYLGEFEVCEAWRSRLIIGGSDKFRSSLLRIQQFWQERWRAGRNRQA